MSQAFARTLFLLLAVSALFGCNSAIPKIANLSPLKQPLMSPGSVALDIFSVRLTPPQVEHYQELWEEVDEQSLSVEVRRRLARNGFRVGVLAGHIPNKLAHLLELRDQPVGDTTQNITPKELADPSGVALRHLQTRTGERSEITSSGIYDQWPVFLTDSGELRGQTYSQAQGVFALKVNAQPDGRVQLDLTPEIQFGDVRQHWVADQGIFRSQPGRSIRSFDDLHITPILNAGSILMLGCQIDRVGSLGHYFFHEPAGREEKLQTKLVLIRLGQTQNDDLVSPPPLPLSK